MTERPTVGAVAEELYAAMAPAFTDVDINWQLLSFCGALGLLLQPMWDVVYGGGEPWSVALDPDKCPAFLLPWLAAVSGVQLVASWDEAQTRQAIKDQAGQDRGSVGAIVKAAQRTLTGSQTVIIHERVGGNAWQLMMRTFTGETPDESLTRQAILQQKPGGIILDYAVEAGMSYADLATGSATYSAAASTYSSYGTLRDTLP